MRTVFNKPLETEVSENKSKYCVCTTAADVAEKTISITDSVFELNTGVIVNVLFQNANTADSPTLNVNSTGAKNVFHRGSQIVSEANKNALKDVVQFIYDGTNWRIIGNLVNSNNTTGASAASGIKMYPVASFGQYEEAQTFTNSNVYVGTDNELYSNNEKVAHADDVEDLQNCIAIVASGNTHAAIASGLAVYVRNHDTLADGLYWANEAIGTNEALNTSNLTADVGGGLNTLKNKIGNVGNTDLQTQVTTLGSTKVNTSDIVNALDNTATNKPLSAAQGKALNDSLTTLNSYITTLKYTGTVNGLQTSLVSLANSMSVGDFHNIKYTAGETLSPFRNTCLYGGTFKRTGNNYWSVMLENPEGLPIYGTYRNGTWSWQELALNSKFTSKSADAASTYTYNNKPIKFFKIGTTCFLYMDGMVNIPAGNTDMCNVPTGFKPMTNFIDDRWINGTKFRMYIKSTTFSIYNYGSTFSDSNISVSITYPVALEE